MSPTTTSTSKLPGGDPFAKRPAAASPTDSLANKSTFLNLLVAQIKNQNPLNPTDGVQFVTQLAQFSQLEQTIGMAGDIAAVRKDLEQTAQPADSITGTQGTAQ